MMLELNKQIYIIDFCPKCDYKLNHINALNTEAKIYIVYCSHCSFCIEYEKNNNGDLKKCL